MDLRLILLIAFGVWATVGVFAGYFVTPRVFARRGYKRQRGVLVGVICGFFGSVILLAFLWLLIGFPRGVTLALTLALAIAVVVAGAVLIQCVIENAQAAAQRAERDAAIALTATAIAPTATPTPQTSARHQREARIILAAWQDAPTLTPSPTLQPLSAATLPPTAILATATPAVTDTPTVIYVVPPTRARPTVAGLFEDYPPPEEPPPTAIPTRMPMADNMGYDIINVLLMGLDTHPDRNGSRSDTIIVVSINRSAGTVNMLSLPRDLFVYIPGWTMQRLNTAASRGDVTDWRGGGGPALLRDTLLYNFGIPIHFHARVDFNGFRRLIDMVGGIDVPVDCTHQDWILKEPGLDEQDENNWELFTLPMGVQHLDGHHALWYARSRRRTSDFDRSRRQQMILRALFNRARSQDLLAQVPALWDEISQFVETDMTLADVLGLVPTALQLDSSRIQSLVFNQWYVQDWTTPGGDAVLLPVADRLELMVQDLYIPPTQNTLVQEQARIEILNGTANEDWDEVAAARLAWEGFVPVAAGQNGEFLPDTVIYDFTGQTKGSSLDKIAEVLNAHPDNIIVQPDPNRAVDYRIILGASYNSCTYNVPPPVPTPTPAPVTGG